MLSALEKVNSKFLRSEFRRDFRRFLEELLTTILPTVATPSPVGHKLSCFCPELFIGGDDYSAFHLFGELLDGLPDFDWAKNSDSETVKAECHLFVLEKRQIV